jgi:ribosomal protein L19
VEEKDWDARYINDLPDEAFAIILPDGTKDENGKTVPRSLRMLPHHKMGVTDPNDNDSVDLPHLRNALARCPQTDMTDTQKSKAQKHLEKHAKDLEIGQWAEGENINNKLENSEEFSKMDSEEMKKLEEQLKEKDEIISKLREEKLRKELAEKEAEEKRLKEELEKKQLEETKKKENLENENKKLKEELLQQKSDKTKGEVKNVDVSEKLVNEFNGYFYGRDSEGLNKGFTIYKENYNDDKFMRLRR